MPQVPVPQAPMEVTGELDAGEGAMPLTGATTQKMKITINRAVYELTPNGDAIVIRCLSGPVAVLPASANFLSVVPIE